MTGMKGEICLSYFTVPFFASCLASHHTTLMNYCESKYHIFHLFCAAGNCAPRITQKSLNLLLSSSSSSLSSSLSSCAHCKYVETANRFSWKWLRWRSPFDLVWLGRSWACFGKGYRILQHMNFLNILPFSILANTNTPSVTYRKQKPERLGF